MKPDEAVNAARSAASGWACAPPEQRARALASVAESLEDARDELVRLAAEETGLGAGRLNGS